jgi:hypothetical protein
MIITNKIKEKPLFYLGFNLIRFFIILSIFDYSTGHALKYFYFKQDIGRPYRAIFSIEKTQADILIFGPSTGFNNYVPEVLETRLKKACYNTGSPGQFMLYHYATLKTILNRYTPKCIILDIIPGEFRAEKESYDRLSFLLPFYKRDTALQSVVDLKGPFEKYKLISSIYPFNSILVTLAAQNTAPYRSRNTVEKGYKARTNVWDKPYKSTSPELYPLDSVKIKIFKSFINDCNHSGTKLVVVCSPRFLDFKKRDISLQIAEKIADEKNVLFLDFTNDTFFLNRPYLFDEPLHLNRKGSQEFTNILADKIYLK